MCCHPLCGPAKKRMGVSVAGFLGYDVLLRPYITDLIGFTWRGIGGFYEKHKNAEKY